MFKYLKPNIYKIMNNQKIDEIIINNLIIIISYMTIFMVILIIIITPLLDIYYNKLEEEIEHQKIINKLLVRQIENLRYPKSAINYYYSYIDYKSCPKNFIIQYPIKKY